METNQRPDTPHTLLEGKKRKRTSRMAPNQDYSSFCIMMQLSVFLHDVSSNSG